VPVPVHHASGREQWRGKRNCEQKAPSFVRHE
jgi:hypothetical protein